MARRLLLMAHQRDCPLRCAQVQFARNGVSRLEMIELITPTRSA
jgi:hypothetical protein